MAEPKNTPPPISISLDDFYQSLPTGSIEKAIGNNLYGINHRQIQGLVPTNKDRYGLTFFVRPQLNLQGDNIRNLRAFYPLLTSVDVSILRYIRMMLDPRLGTVGNGVSTAIKSPMVDNTQAFIPVLTNNLVSISGWNDVTVPYFDSKKGLYGEVYSQPDGTTDIYGSYDITATFRNTRGDPIVYLFYIWELYMSKVFEGKLVPYPDYIMQNRLDFNTRIYRLVLDPTMKYVRKIAACGVAYPLNVPVGQYFDFTNDKPFNDQTKDISINLHCLGASYFDDILIKEFNEVVAIFNPDMRIEKGMTDMIKVPQPLLQYFNNRGYPRINPNDYELEWYVPKDLYNKVVNTVLNNPITNTAVTFKDTPIPSSSKKTILV